MKKFILFFSLILFFSEIAFAGVTPNQMITIAGKQRMLSQEIAKNYLLQAYGANLVELKSDLEVSKIIFERNLETLEENSKDMYTENVHKKILKEKISWNKFKEFLDKPVNEKSIERVLNLSDILLKTSDEVIDAIKNESIDDVKFNASTKLLSTIDNAGKQCMLSQRLCLYFIAKKFDLKYGIRNLRNDTALYAIYNNLDEVLVDLLNSELNTRDIEKAIGQALLTFENLRSQKDAFINGTASMNIVFNTTNELTEDFERVTLKYAELKPSLEDFISVR